MRKLIFIAVLCAFVASSALADFGHGAGYDGGTANWDRKGSYCAGQGGEFTIWEPSLLLSNSAYADSTSGLVWDTRWGKTVGGPESFQTFCIETGEYIYEPMEVWVSEASTATPTVYGSGSHAWKGGTGLGDDLDAKTAYLYTQFATGNLSNYAYSGTVNGLNRSQTAGALQRLIWNIEDEGGLLTAGNSFKGITLNAAQVILITSWRDEYTTSGWTTGIGNVRVLQTYQQIGGPECTFELKQDQLYLTPVPGAVLLGILGLSVAGIKLRKFA